MSVTPACPLCGADGRVPSWLGATMHAGNRYEYFECTTCKSLYCDPMPSAAALTAMYGEEYRTAWADPGQPIEADLDSLLGVLREWAVPGTLIDFGCGTDGRVLHAAVGAGWRALGVELTDEVATAAAEATGIDVLTVDAAAAMPEPVADVLHLGDVVEHLTGPLTELGRALRLLRPGGLVVARGPLEANPNLFTAAVRLARRLRRRPPSAMPPYHVTLATVRGQRALFSRLGLEEQRFEVSEVAWPAPAHVSIELVGRPRVLGLYLLRRASVLSSRLGQGRWGNRYLYVGRRT